MIHTHEHIIQDISQHLDVFERPCFDDVIEKKDQIENPNWYFEAKTHLIKFYEEKSLSSEHEYDLGEVFSAFSQNGFNYFFPKALIAQLNGNFGKGLLSDVLWDTINLDADRKYGRGRKQDMFIGFLSKINSPQKTILAQSLRLIFNEDITL